jgi:hypothetical protein
VAWDDDEDRKAILARRNRFVAIALTGLAAGPACGDDATPMVCLEAAPVEMTPIAPAPPPEEPKPPEVEAPPPADDTETETAMEDVSEMAPDMRRPRPRACLSIRRPPTPCLNVAPQVCLSEEIEFKPGGDDDDA